MSIRARFSLGFDDFYLGVNLKFPAQGVTTLFGPSGAGKSTVLRCIAGLERSPNGLMQVGDEIWQDETQGIFLPANRRSLGYVFQEPRLFPHLNVQDNLDFGYKRTPQHLRRINRDQIIQIFDIGHLLPRKPNKLSGGEKQRISIGRALLGSPKLLLMDEPLASLDMERKQEVLPFIRKLHEHLDIPVIYVSHSLQEILQITDTMILMRDGKNIAIGSMSELSSDLTLSKYLGDMTGSVIETTVNEHDIEFALTRLKFNGGEIYVPQQSSPIGSQQRIQILARNVGIALQKPQVTTSFLNILEATVIEVLMPSTSDYAVLIKLDIGVPLLASISRKSLQLLDLTPGEKCYALIKAVSLVNSLHQG